MNQSYANILYFVFVLALLLGRPILGRIPIWAFMAALSGMLALDLWQHGLHSGTLIFTIPIVYPAILILWGLRKPELREMWRDVGHATSKLLRMTARRLM